MLRGLKRNHAERPQRGLCQGSAQTSAGVHITVPEHLLHRPDVVPVLRRLIRGRRMSQAVTRSPLRPPRSHHCRPMHPFDLVHVGHERGPQRRRHHVHPILRTLPVPHHDLATPHVHDLVPNPQALHQPQPPIARWGGCVALREGLLRCVWMSTRTPVRQLRSTRACSSRVRGRVSSTSGSSTRGSGITCVATPMRAGRRDSSCSQDHRARRMMPAVTRVQAGSRRSGCAR